MQIRKLTLSATGRKGRRRDLPRLVWNKQKWGLNAPAVWLGGVGGGFFRQRGAPPHFVRHGPKGPPAGPPWLGGPGRDPARATGKLPVVWSRPPVPPAA